MPQNEEASKWKGQKQVWQLASRWEVTTQHTSTRLQRITVAQGYSIPHYHICETRASQGRELAFRNFPWFLHHSLLLLFKIPHDHFGGVI
jgi:hypothetical protein